jgi:hypothetical protein
LAKTAGSDDIQNYKTTGDHNKAPVSPMYKFLIKQGLGDQDYCLLKKKDIRALDYRRLKQERRFEDW